MKSGILIFKNQNSYNYKELNCFDPDFSYSYWNSVFAKDNFMEANKKYIVIYQGLASREDELSSDSIKKTSYILKYEGYDFQIYTDPTFITMCGQKGFNTDNPSLYIVENSEGLGFQLKKTDVRLSSNINMMTYMNKKFTYLFRHSEKELKKTYDFLKYQQCLLNQRISQNLRTLAMISPNHFTFEYFRQAEMTGTVRGEVIYVVKCHIAPVTIRKITDRCFQELPITYNN